MAVDLRFSPISIHSSCYNTPVASPWPLQSELNNDGGEQDGGFIPPSVSSCGSDLVIESFLNCLLCNEQMTRPIMLPCLDNFCMNCLRLSYHEQRQNRDRLRREEAEKRTNRARRRLRASTDIPLVHHSLHMTGHSPLIPDSPVPSMGLDEEVSSEEGSVRGDDHSSTVSNSSIGSSQSGIVDCFRCPLNDCRHLVPTVSLDDIGQLDGLRVNLPLQNIKRTESIKQDLPQGHVPCGSCGRVAVGVCYNKDCSNRPFCAKCQEFHLRDNKVHKIAHPNAVVIPGAPSPPSVPPRVHHEARREGSDDDDDSAVGELMSEGDGPPTHEIAWKDLKQCDILCDRHGKPMNLYCSDHDEVICESCTNVHSLHRTCRSLEFAVDVYKTELEYTRARLDEIEELNKQVQSAIKTTTELVKALAEKTECTKQSIADRYDHLVNQLQQHRNELLNKCDRLYNLKAAELNQHKDMLNRVSETFVRCSSFVTWFTGTAIPSEYMMLKTQINRYLEQLLRTRARANYQYQSVEDDCIFYNENTRFDMSNAIGQVYSTPSVKNFSLARYSGSPMVAHQPAQFRVVVQDVLRNELFLSRSSMPLLRATLRHVEEEEPSEGYVRIMGSSHATGRYNVIVYPNRGGEHELCVYHPMRAPYDRWYVGQKESYTVIVDEDQSVLTATFPLRR